MMLAPIFGRLAIPKRVQAKLAHALLVDAGVFESFSHVRVDRQT